MTHLILTALVNSIAVTTGVAIIVSLFLRFPSAGAWNARTREAVWWAALAAAVVTPLFYARADVIFTSNTWKAAPAAQVAAGASWRLGSSVPVQIASIVAESENPTTAVGTRRRPPIFPIQIQAGRWPSWVLSAWAAVSLLLLGRLVFGYIQLRRRIDRAVEAHQLAGRAQQWMHSLGANRRRIRIALSEEIASPVAIGPFRPAILLPAAVMQRLAEDDLDRVGLHEAAHLARRDDVWLLFQRIVEALFVFHPVVRWITRRIDLEREIACDDAVINTISGPRQYALCLTRLAEISVGIGPVLGASFNQPRSHLERRVDMLLNDRRTIIMQLSKTRLALLLGAVTVMTFTAGKLPGVFSLAQPLQAKAAIAREAPAVSAQRQSVAPAIAIEPEPVKTAPRLPIISTNQQAGVGPAITGKVPVLVTDRLGRYVSGLEKIHFRLLEDGVEQEISEFLPSVRLQSERVSIVVAYSAGGGAGSANPREALQALLRSLGPADEFALFSFEATPRPAAQMLLLDAVRLAVSKAQAAQNVRRAVLIVSDAGMGEPVYDETALKAVVAAADIPIYALSFFPSQAVQSLMDELALNTGGRHFQIGDTAGLAQSSDIPNKIAVAVRNMYMLTFQSTNRARDGRYRKLEVELVPPRGIPSLNATYRTGYYPD